MNVIRLAIDRPIAVVAAVLMVILFGLLALQTIPIQLTPDVQRPVITVSTSWAGAAPAEIEREILIPQEDVLAGMEGVTDMLSEGWTGEGEITLEFAIGTDMDRALLLVANRLDRVTAYPDEADEPVLETASSEDKPIARFNLVRAPGNERPIDDLFDHRQRGADLAQHGTVRHDCVIEDHIGTFTDNGLGIKSNREPRSLHHIEIICPITDGHCLTDRRLGCLRPFNQGLCLGGGIDHLAEYTARQ